MIIPRQRLCYPWPRFCCCGTESFNLTNHFNCFCNWMWFVAVVRFVKDSMPVLAGAQFSGWANSAPVLLLLSLDCGWCLRWCRFRLRTSLKPFLVLVICPLCLLASRPAFNSFNTIVFLPCSQLKSAFLSDIAIICFVLFAAFIESESRGTRGHIFLSQF
jgi:hypothetical protein